MKKLLISSFSLVLSFLIFSESVFAAEVQTGLYIGTKDGNPTPIMAACSETQSCEFVRVKVGGKGVGGLIDLVFLDDNNGFVGDFAATITEDTWSFDVTAPPGAKRLRIGINNGGQEAFLMEAVNTKEPDTVYLYNYDPPSDTGGGDTGGETCDSCGFLDCPGWGEYMGKMDEIISTIPPPPNWGEVAETFRNSIVPSLVDETRNMLGSTPAPPSPPPDMPGISVGSIVDNAPILESVPNLEESGFDKGKLEEEAPVIDFRQDESGGFEIKDPVDSIPDYPTENPIPGETVPGEWGEHVPEEQEATTPIPSGQEDVIGEEAPIPGGNDDSPPMPGEGGDSPPMPGGGGDSGGTTRYKKHPDDPDGSG